MFKWFTKTFHKLVYVVTHLYAIFNPIYKDIRDIIKTVKDKGFEGKEAQLKVFNAVKKLCKQLDIDWSDSRINCIIEVIYQLVKLGKE